MRCYCVACPVFVIQSVRCSIVVIVVFIVRKKCKQVSIAFFTLNPFAKHSIGANIWYFSSFYRRIVTCNQRLVQYFIKELKLYTDPTFKNLTYFHFSLLHSFLLFYTMNALHGGYVLFLLSLDQTSICFNFCNSPDCILQNCCAGYSSNINLISIRHDFVTRIF